MIAVPWSDQAAGSLVQALGIYLSDIAAQVKAGACQLYKIHDHGYVVIRREGEEFVIVAGEGSGFDDYMPGIIEQARREGFESVRLHATRKGIVRMSEKHGYEWEESIMRVSL